LPYEFTVKVAQRGKITIPHPLRETLNIRDGDIVTVSLLEVARKTSGQEKQETSDREDQLASVSCRSQ